MREREGRENIGGSCVASAGSDGEGLSFLERVVGSWAGEDERLRPVTVEMVEEGRDSVARV